MSGAPSAGQTGSAHNDPAPNDPARTGRRWPTLLAVVVGYLILFGFTPGLHSFGVGSWFTEDLDVQLIIEVTVAALLAVVLLMLHRRINAEVFAASKARWLYLLPVILLALLPLHYTIEMPLVLYAVWMTVSVFFQDYLTFGLLQSYLRRSLPSVATILIVAVLFLAVHMAYIPHRFVSVLPALGILAMGLVVALLREKLKTLHLILVLHLATYFIFA